ncbi:MAG: LysM peptidoglycan-binding domain-containing protein, partial [Caldilineaceae bacterium SB0675_bin_29]|nr:LysM peptidoglycan-binding domain-containing protein [Caldilineaceae bacterium SB0675_bin_29]
MRAGITQLRASRRIWLISVATVLLFSLLPQSVTAASLLVNVNPQTTGYTTHVVQAGETLSRIAANYGVSLQALVTANNIADPNQIFVGQSLRIPTTGQQAAPSQPTTCARTHNVVAGESLSGIAVNYGVSIQNLAQANGVSVTSYVYIGQQLCIPGSGTSGGGGGGTTAGTPSSGGGFWYEVQLGDTLSRIAFNNGTSVAAIMRANSLANANTLF